jgi:mRNA-degrading endonuclease toxin of MazEF toxin-antitoxin module
LGGTSVRQYKNLPVQVHLTSTETGLLNKDSCVECGHVAAIDRGVQIESSKGVIGRVADVAMARIDLALKVSPGL